MTMNAELESTTVDNDGSIDTGATDPEGNPGYKSVESSNANGGCNNIMNHPTMHQVDPEASCSPTASAANQTKSTRNKVVMTLLSISLLLAISILFVALSSSFWKRTNSRDDDLGQQHSIVVADDVDMEGELTYGWDDDDEIIDYIEYDTEADEEGDEDVSEGEDENEVLDLLPEDCDSPDCMHQLYNATSNYGEYEEEYNGGDGNEDSDSQDEQLSIFTGPISDFIVTNLTSMRAISSSSLRSSSTTANVRASNRCNNNQMPAKFALDTDEYSWETSWSIKRTSNSKLFASGPPPNRNYARATRYVGVICLPPGRYELVVNDIMGDGLCCTHGRGKVKLMLGGRTVAATRTNTNEKFRVKKFGFTVPTPSSGGGNASGNSGGVTFRRGDLAVDVPRLGIKICSGMSVKVLARANQQVRYSNGQFSALRFHSMPDGAAVLPVNGGGYVYVSNSEMKEKLGGVYGLYFDGAGNVVDYKKLLGSTTRNCGGGVTPWDTWISCEEYGKGQCIQVDPNNQRAPEVTKLGGNGGNYESVAVDNRNQYQPVFYVSEDAEFGALRKYTPPMPFSFNGIPVVAKALNWDTLHTPGGTTEYLRFIPGTNRFVWTTNEQAARNSQAQFYRNVEGIDYHDGKLYFVSKKLHMMYILDLTNGTYTTSSTKDGILQGAGEFRQQPDQIVRNTNGGSGEYLYVTEDGGKTVGVYARHVPTGKRYAMFEAYSTKYHHDETTGLAFSLDGRKMYAAFQDCGCANSEDGVDYNCGCLLEFSRNDGMSFDGSTLSLKFHGGG